VVVDQVEQGLDPGLLGRSAAEDGVSVLLNCVRLRQL
jgi:hypothetical protein